MKHTKIEGTITTKQLDYIESLMEQVDMSNMELLSKCSELRGSRISHYSDLTKQEASDIIGYLKLKKE